MNYKTTLKLTIFAALILMLSGFAFDIAAQPTSAQLKRKLTHKKTVSVKLGRPGKTSWSSTYKKFMWTRSFVAKLRTDVPKVYVIVSGYAAYNVIGRRFTFWRTFITSNSYEGIESPSTEDVQKLIKKFGLERFMGQYSYRRIIGEIESIDPAKEPKYLWHTMNSVSMNMVVVYTARTNDVGGKQRVAKTFRIRFYRDNMKQDWQSMLSMGVKNVKKL